MRADADHRTENDRFADHDIAARASLPLQTRGAVRGPERNDHRAGVLRELSGQARQIRGTFHIRHPTADSERAKRRAAEARRVIAELDARPVAEAAEWLTPRREQQRADREALQARQEALARRDAGPIGTGPDQRRGRSGLSL